MFPSWMVQNVGQMLGDRADEEHPNDPSHDNAEEHPDDPSHDDEEHPDDQSPSHDNAEGHGQESEAVTDENGKDPNGEFPGHDNVEGHGLESVNQNGNDKLPEQEETEPKRKAKGKGKAKGAAKCKPKAKGKAKGAAKCKAKAKGKSKAAAAKSGALKKRPATAKPAVAEQPTSVVVEPPNPESQTEVVNDEHPKNAELLDDKEVPDVLDANSRLLSEENMEKINNVFKKHGLSDEFEVAVPKHIPLFGSLKVVAKGQVLIVSHKAPRMGKPPPLNLHLLPEKVAPHRTRLLSTSASARRIV